MPRIAERFAKQDTLIEALSKQVILRGDRKVASVLAEGGEVVTFAPGEELIQQNAGDDDCYFLLAGKIEMTINGQLLPYGRSAGEVVGEFSAINPELTRTATVSAAGEVVALKCSAALLKQAFHRKAEIWRLLAVDLTRKLEQRNRFIASRNERPRIFIIAAEKRIEIAKELKLALAKDFVVDLWIDDDLIPPGGYELEILRDTAKSADFAIVLAHPDDLNGRGRQGDEEWRTIRFELGYLMAELSRYRTLLLIPNGDHGEPTLFKGVQPMTYQLPVDDMPMKAALAEAVRQIRDLVNAQKVRTRLEEPKSAGSTTEGQAPRTTS